ncbi:MAG: glutathione S-transferase N-terminal domain-containing protein [Acidobacteriota bacterium]
MTHPSRTPILYTFRRCPYAIRARMAIDAAGVTVEAREVLLRDKPQVLLEASPKGTVPVLVLLDGSILEESLDVMQWALETRDPEDWLRDGAEAVHWLERVEREFKPRLDGYKYGHRGPAGEEERCRSEGAEWLRSLEGRLAQGHVLGAQRTLADVGTFPFVRQFVHHDRVFFANLELARVSAWLEDFLAGERFARVMTKHPVWQPEAATE